MFQERISSQDQSPGSRKKKSNSSSTFSRVARHTLLRMVTLFLTVVIGVYLAVLIANMGGYIE